MKRYVKVETTRYKNMLDALHESGWSEGLMLPGYFDHQDYRDTHVERAAKRAAEDAVVLARREALSKVISVLGLTGYETTTERRKAVRINYYGSIERCKETVTDHGADRLWEDLVASESAAKSSGALARIKASLPKGKP